MEPRLYVCVFFVCLFVCACVCVSAVSLESPVALFTVTNTVKIRTQTPQVCV